MDLTFLAPSSDDLSNQNLATKATKSHGKTPKTNSKHTLPEFWGIFAGSGLVANHSVGSFHFVFIADMKSRNFPLPLLWVSFPYQHLSLADRPKDSHAYAY